MKTYRYLCVKNEQRTHSGAPLFLLFCAKAGDIMDWAAIERHTEDSKKGPQRLPKPAKVAEVARFLKQDPRNTIPTSLIISLHVDLSKITPVEGHPELVSLTFDYDDQKEPSEKPGMIVDGQHRLLGVKDFQTDLLLNVVAIINASDDETAFQFLVVNNKASRVSSNHLRALALKFKEEDLDKRLRNIRMSISQHLDFVGLVDTDPQR